MITPEELDKLLANQKERFRKAEEEEKKKKEQEIERLRQDYMRRTGRKEMKP